MKLKRWFRDRLFALLIVILLVLGIAGARAWLMGFTLRRFLAAGVGIVVFVIVVVLLIELCTWNSDKRD